MIRPQIEQVFDKVAKSKGRLPVSQAMREVGYSSISAGNPTKLTRSKTWQRLVQKHLPDTLLTKTHKRLLDKEELIVVDKEIIHTGQPHSDVKFALDMAYKLKDKFPHVNPNTIVPIQINFNQDREEFK